MRTNGDLYTVARDEVFRSSSRLADGALFGAGS